RGQPPPRRTKGAAAPPPARFPAGLWRRGQRLSGPLLGDGHPGDHVGDHPEPVGQGKDDEGDPQQHRVDPQVAADPAAHPGDQLLAAAAAHHPRPTAARRRRLGPRWPGFRGELRAHPLEHMSSGLGHDTAMTTTETGPLPSFLMDMDGVLVHEAQVVPGAARFINARQAPELPFLVLTNNSIYTQRDLSARLARTGIELPPERIWTSALATAKFLDSQRPGGRAFAIGEAGLTTALHNVDYTLSERDPDYVVLGETRTYSFELITKAIRLIERGARFIATN